MSKTVWAAYQVARNRHRISRFPADSLPLPTWPALSYRSGEGVRPLYTYSIYTVT